MRTPALVRICFFGLLVALIATFGQGRNRTDAASTAVAASNSAYIDVPGLFFNSYASLTQAVSASDTSINITDAGCLRVGWTVRVQDTPTTPELMLITQLIPGTSGNPDTMVVTRAQGGTSAVAHAAGVPVQTRALSIDIMAQNVSDPAYGFGAFNVQVAVPSQLQLIEFNYDSTWLSSTGRIPDCLGAVQQSPGVWQLSCASLPNNNDQSWYPRGANGTGRIARLTVLPPSSVGNWAIGLTGSYLLNVPGQDLNAVVSSPSVTVVNCPDTNLDGRVNTTDMLNVARNLGDRGTDSGVTITSDITASQAGILISDPSRLSPNSIIAIDNESMKVLSLITVPKMMTVTRGVNYPQPASHKSGAHIYLATADGNGDGMYAYTPTRDVTHDGVINTTDLLRVARVSVLTQTCPTPPS